MLVSPQQAGDRVSAVAAWNALPADVRGAVSHGLGGQLTLEETELGGSRRIFGGKVRTPDGRSYFLKIVSNTSEHFRSSLRQAADVTRLPASIYPTPPLVDHGRYVSQRTDEEFTWLTHPWIDGQNAQSACSKGEDLGTVLPRVADLAVATALPVSCLSPGPPLRDVGAEMRKRYGDCWGEFVRNPDLVNYLDPKVRPLVTENLGDFVQAEQRARDHFTSGYLCQLDLGLSNVQLSSDSSENDKVVDCNLGSGPVWHDLVGYCVDTSWLPKPPSMAGLDQMLDRGLIGMGVDPSIMDDCLLAGAGRRAYEQAHEVAGVPVPGPKYMMWLESMELAEQLPWAMHRQTTRRKNGVNPLPANSPTSNSHTHSTSQADSRKLS